MEAAGNVQYTFIAHWNIVNRLKEQYWIIKIAQIVLTALAAGGFLTSLISGIPQLSWLGGLTSAIALGINLYMLNFNLPDNIKQHTDAANVSDINKRYPGTDEKSFIKTQKDIEKYEFDDGEAAKVLNIKSGK